MGLARQMRPLLLVACLGGLYGWALHTCEESGGLVIPEVYASDGVTSDMGVSVNCQRDAIMVFLPEIKYAVQPSEQCQLQLTSESPVNGLPLPSANCQSAAGGAIEISHRTPVFKVSGLLCQPVKGMSVDASQRNYSSHGKGFVMIDQPQSTQWSDRKAMTAEGRTLFGTWGSIWNAPIDDGQDFDMQMNGEVVFGGAASQGGSTTIIRASRDDSGNRVTDLPQILYTFNPHQS